MLELATLQFKADTGQLDDVITKIKTIKQEIAGIKPMKNPLVDGGTGASGGGSGGRRRAAKEEADGVSAVTKAIEKKTETLKVMRNQEINAADGTIRLGDAFTRSQASALAMLKILGATTAEMKQMATVFNDMNAIMGVDPFDKSAGNLRSMRKEVEELNYVNRLMTNGINLSKKEIQGLSRDIIRVTETMKAEGTTAADLAKAVQKLTNETVALSRAKAIEEQQLKSMEAARAAEAKKALDAETLKKEAIARTTAAMERQEAMIARTNAKVGFMEQGFSVGASSQAATMKMAGVSDTEINTFLQRMKQLEDASKAARKAEADRAREAKKNGDGNSDAHRKAAAAAEWLRLTEERLATQLKETDNAMRKQYTDTLVKLRENLNRSGLSATEAEAKFKRLEGMVRQVASKENARNLDNLARAVSVQMGDVAISLASGMNPLLVLIQQGDQIRGAIQQSGVAGKQLQDTMFVAAQQIASSFKMAGQAIGGFFVGAINAAGSAGLDLGAKMLGLTKMLTAWEAAAEISAAAGNKFNKVLFNIARTVVGLGVGAAATALLSFAVGAFQAMRENDKLARSLALTNGALAITHDQAFAAAAAFEAAGGNAGKFLTVLSEAGKTGELTASQVNLIAEAVINLERYGGVAIADTVKKFADLQKDPVDALAKLQKETGMVTRALFNQVEALTRVGREYEAGQLAVQEYARISELQVETIKSEYTGLGLAVTKAFEVMNNAWDKFIEGVWRRTGSNSPIAALEKELMLLEAGLNKDGTNSLFRKDRTAEIENVKEQIRLQKQLMSSQAVAAEDRRKQDLLEKEAREARIKGLSSEERILQKIAEYAIKVGQAENPADKETFHKMMLRQYKELEELRKPKSSSGNREKSQFEKDMEVFNDLLQNAEGNTNRFNNQIAALERLLVSKEFSKVIGDDAEAVRKLVAAFKELESQQPGFREAQKQKEEYLKRVTKETTEYEASVRRLEQAQIDAMVAEHEQADAILNSANMTKLSSLEQEKFNKLIKAGIEYRKELATIERLYDNDDPRKADAMQAAAAVYAKRVENALTEAHIKSIQAYEEYFNDISKNISDVIATALIDGGNAGKKKLRDLIANELRKRITLQIDAFINPIMGQMATAMFGSPAAAGAAAQGAGGGIGSGLANMVMGSQALSNLGTYLSTGWQMGMSGQIGTAMSSAGNLMASGSTMGGLAHGAGAMAPYMLAIAAGNYLGKKIGGDYQLGSLGKSTDKLGPLLGTIASGGTAGGMLLGSLGSGAARRLFGRKPAQVTASGIEGTFGPSGFMGRGFVDTFSKGGTFRSDKRSTSYSDLDFGISQGLSSSFQQIGFDVKQMADVLGLGSESLKSFTYNARIDLNGLSEEDALKKLQEEFAKISDAMVDSVANLQSFKRYGESSTETMTRLATTLGQMNNALNLLNWSVYETSLSGFAAADSFVNMFGGLDQATSALGTYFDKFYTAEEKVAKSSELLSKEFTKIGVQMPSTIEGFRLLVEQFKAAGNNQSVADLLLLSKAFSDFMETQKEALADYTSLQRRILELQGNTAALRELELKGLDATAAALQKQIWALEDLQTAQAEYAKFVEQYTSRGANLREFVERRQGGGENFAQVMQRARNGDLSAIDRVEGAATSEIDRARANATSLNEAFIAEQRILQDVMSLATSLENFSGSSLEERLLQSQVDSNVATVSNTSAITALTEKLSMLTASSFVVEPGSPVSLDTVNGRLVEIEANTRASALSLNKIVKILERVTPDGENLNVVVTECVTICETSAPAPAPTPVPPPAPAAPGLIVTAGSTAAVVGETVTGPTIVGTGPGDTNWSLTSASPGMIATPSSGSVPAGSSVTPSLSFANAGTFVLQLTNLSSGTTSGTPGAVVVSEAAPPPSPASCPFVSSVVDANTVDLWLFNEAAGSPQTFATVTSTTPATPMPTTGPFAITTNGECSNGLFLGATSGSSHVLISYGS